MSLTSYCTDHGYLNTSSKVKYCPVGGERLLRANLSSAEISRLQLLARGLFQTDRVEGDIIVRYPSNYNVETGVKLISVEGTAPAMKK